MEKQEASSAPPTPESVPPLAQNPSKEQSQVSPYNFEFDAEKRQALLLAARQTSGQYAPSLNTPPVVIVPATPPRPLKSPAQLLVAALGLGGMVDALFYGQRAGIGIPLFALLALGALIGLALRENLRTNIRAILFTSVPLLFFTGMVAIRDNEFLTALNIIVSLFLAGLLAHFFAGGNLATLKIGGFLGLPWLSFGHTIVGAAPAIKQVMENHAGRSEGRNKIIPVLRGLLLALPILAVLVPLLISADAVFAQQSEHFFGWLFPKNWYVRLGRLMIILGAAWFIAGGFVYALTRQEREGVPQAEAGKPIGFTEGMTPLVLVCALFAGFLMVQAEYLFGGNARVQAIPGLTYAEYARRGFGELVTVAVLTLSLALGWQRLMQREGTTQIRLFKGGLTLLVGLTLVLLASAYQRMAAYEMAYGATETRLYVDAFIVFLGAVLSWFAVTLWTETQRFFAFGGFLCVLAYVASLNLLNPDAAVARTNIARSLAGKQSLDSYTLQNMSDDALPALCAALDKTTGQERNLLASVLRLRLTQREEDRKKVSWPSWNAAREFGLRELRRRSSELPTIEQANQYSGTGSCTCE